MFKKAKVVMLPTNQKAYIFLTKDKLEYKKSFTEHGQANLTKQFNSAGYQAQYLYFLSDEEIKENEFDTLLKQGLYFESSNGVIKVITKNRIKTVGIYKKIIATTDSSLKINGCLQIMCEGNCCPNISLPQPSQSFIDVFIEEYDKNNIITDVMVEYINIRTNPEEPDSYALYSNPILKINPKNNTITIKRVKDSWTKEEHEKTLRNLAQAIFNKYYFGDGVFDIDKWIEKNL